jgi:TolB-like protein
VNAIYRFENCVLDAQRRELRRSDKLVPVEPQVFDLLEYLVRNRDRVVTKDEILTSIWGGRAVSESALTSRINSARTAIGDDGKGQRLIKTLRHKGMRFVGAAREDDGHYGIAQPAEPAAQHSTPVLPDNPSIAVLPFTNLSGDPTQDYFADGMVEEITMALGRLPWLFVIASASAFTYKGRAVDVRQVGTELGVRYVLQGSVRKQNDRVRIAVQLTDASQGHQILSERFEGELQEVFTLQDQVATQLSARIAPTLRSKEVERVRRKPTTNLTAYDLFLRAIPPRRDTLEQNNESLRLLYKAIELDPGFSTAYGLAAWCHEVQVVFGWLPPSDVRVKEGLRLANLAVETGEKDPEALWMAGISIARLSGDYARGADLIERSLSLNPNSARAWWASGVLYTHLGRAELALESYERSRRLNPLDTAGYAYWAAIATTRFHMAGYEAALECAERALADWPDSPVALRVKAAICGLQNRLAEGKVCVQRLLAINPHTTIETVRADYGAQARHNLESYEALLRGLRLSGLPESTRVSQSRVTKLRSV